MQFLESFPIAKFQVQLWWFSKCAYTSGKLCRGAKIRSILAFLDRKRAHMQLSCHRQVSCSNMVVLKIGLYFGNHAPRAKM